MKLRLPWCTATALLASESLWVIACGEDSDSSSDSGSTRAQTRSHWLRLKVRRVKQAGTGSLRPGQATPKATFQSPCGSKLSLDGPSGLGVNLPVISSQALLILDLTCASDIVGEDHHDSDHDDCWLKSGQSLVSVKVISTRVTRSHISSLGPHVQLEIRLFYYSPAGRCGASWVIVGS